MAVLAVVNERENDKRLWERRSLFSFFCEIKFFSRGCGVGERHLLPTPLPIKYFMAKFKDLETRLITILIGKGFRCNDFCYTRPTTFFMSKPVSPCAFLRQDVLTFFCHWITGLTNYWIN